MLEKPGIKEKSDERELPPVEWSVEEEIMFLFAVDGLKPTGVNKHFYMACIAERLSKFLKRDVPSDKIWAHLRTLYNLDEVDDEHELPFPNDEKEFSLPDEFTSLLMKKRAESGSGNEEANTSTTTESSGKGNSSIAAKDSVASDRKASGRVEAVPKRAVKRTRGSLDLAAGSPSVSTPPLPQSKRRRI